MIRKQNSQLPFFLFVIALFLGLAGSRLFAEGMFIDGLCYAAISRNMSEGLGSFWSPHYTVGIFPEFYEHPPLGLGLQSLWFSVFGDSILVERVYSLFTFIATGFLIALLWKELTNDIKKAWLPLLLWITVPLVPWAYTNNMLENTMSVFVCLSAWLYVKSMKKPGPGFIFLSGLALSLALLTKGFIALYIWTFPFFNWLIFRKERFGQMFRKSTILVLATVLPICLMYLFSGEVRNSFERYFEQQVLWNSQYANTVNNRFYILLEFSKAILPPVVIAILILLLNNKFGQRSFSFRENHKPVMLLFLISLSGVLPIMISVKQSNFYILTVFPFFSIALGLLLHPIITPLTDLKPSHIKLITIIAIALCTAGLAFTLSRANKPGRDAILLSDCKKVIEATGKEKMISICPGMYNHWKLHAYFARYGKISLVPDSNSNSTYYMTDSTCGSHRVPGYPDAGVKLELFRLYLKK